MGRAAHPLDLPAWSALTTQHRGFATGNDRALRYPPEVAPFAGIPDASTESLTALLDLMQDGDHVALFSRQAVTPPPELPSLEVARRIVGRQMVERVHPPALNDVHIETLGAPDADEMLALVELTKPGPFERRTHEMGAYYGVRDGRRLIAMAGERFHLDGFTEVSAVCTHPDYRGRGYSRALIARVTQGIRARGETPFLHVVADNHSAIALYRSIGFTTRRRMHLTVLTRRDRSDAPSTD